MHRREGNIKIDGKGIANLVIEWISLSQDKASYESL
jgi:hypothetical protein